ncbi:hypothetical protein ACWDYH_32065 [Nocardia goodfellowii]|uniref:Bacterial Pleckstrin homology domain-containing protein n=1 Tax=Nocardia goodfellowii TaxID=882446 RepID=A0ABS4QP22_9NOCA|nr:hypothetical protein [Nocardia goodfellowii]MBP2193459.1 hypothetical protein [Nocardia goodfellowii]
MVEVEVTDDTVKVHVLGGHRLLALRDEVTLDVSHIKEVKIAEVDLRPPWIRTPGAFFPGAIAAGTFRGKGRKEFWDTNFKGHAIRIDLDGPGYTRLVIDVADPGAALAELTSAVAA